MQKSEKTAEPSMEEILASIRKIIAEEPPQAPQQKPVAPVPKLDESNGGVPEAAVPPGSDLSDMLDGPAVQDALQEPEKVAAASSDAADNVIQPAETIQSVQAASAPEKSPFSQVDAAGESPLMARLRGLSGIPTTEAEAPSPAAPDAATGLDQPQAREEPTAAPATTPSFLESLDSTKSKPIEEPTPVEQPEPLGSLLAEPAETAFGKNAAAGIEAVPISIEPEASTEASTEAPTDASMNVAEAAEITKSELAPEEATDDDQAQPAPAQIDSVFASLTNGPAFGESKAVQDLPILPHQEVPKSQPEPLAPEPSAANLSTATVESVPVEAAEPTSPRADLEAALVALVEPVVHRWLAENVPALVEKALAEKIKDQ